MNRLESFKTKVDLPFSHFAPFETKGILQKVIKVALLIFFLYEVRSVETSLQEKSCKVPKVRENFSFYMRQIPEAGLMANERGDRYCSIWEGIPTLKECDVLSKYAEKEVKKQHPEFLQDFDLSPYGETGFMLTLGDSIVSFGANSIKLKNHQNALDYLEKNVLQNELFATENPKEILDAIQETHKRLLHKMLFLEGQAKQAGEFREGNMYVASFDKQEGFEDSILKKIKESGWTQAEIKLMKKVLKKIKRSEDLLPHEEALFNKIGRVAPPPSLVPEELKVFAKDLQIKIQKIRRGEEDAVQVAAWVHQEIARIHPFEDGNGRVARAWMNTILQLGGYEAVAFQNNDSYDLAVGQDFKVSGEFIAFLRKTIRWNHEQKTQKNNA